MAEACKPTKCHEERKPKKCHGPGYASPQDAFENGPKEKIVYTTAIYTGTGVGKPDYLATIDVDEKSATYCQVIHRTELGVNDELHHFGWDACSSCYSNPDKRRRHLVLPGLLSGNVYVLDTENLRAPKVIKKIDGEKVAQEHDLRYPHTSHCLGDGNVMISYMGDNSHNGRGDYLLLDSTNDFEPAKKAVWSDDMKGTRYGYDFWYQPRHNVMISSEWGSPSAFSKGFDPSLVASHYGSKLHVWNWTEHKVIQEIELGPEGLIPLELRFHHNPASKHGFVGCALSSNIFHFYLDDETNKWKAEKVIQVDVVGLDGWALPHCPGLITDILISMDDKYLYFSNWLHGDIRQYDISDPSHPKLVGQLFVGGVFQEGTPFSPSDKSVKRPKNPCPKGVYLQGGPQMLQLSLDGKRLYVTNSLFSPWDNQFYPDMVKKGAQMYRVNCDIDNDGGLSIDETFVVDFGQEPEGPALCHETRYPGGDCSSDIWL